VSLVLLERPDGPESGGQIPLLLGFLCLHKGAEVQCQGRERTSATVQQ